MTVATMAKIEHNYDESQFSSCNLTVADMHYTLTYPVLFSSRIRVSLVP